MTGSKPQVKIDGHTCERVREIDLGIVVSRDDVVAAAAFKTVEGAAAPGIAARSGEANGIVCVNKIGSGDCFN